LPLDETLRRGRPSPTRVATALRRSGRSRSCALPRSGRELKPREGSDCAGLRPCVWRPAPNTHSVVSAAEGCDIRVGLAAGVGVVVITGRVARVPFAQLCGTSRANQVGIEERVSGPPSSRFCGCDYCGGRYGRGGGGRVCSYRFGYYYLQYAYVVPRALGRTQYPKKLQYLPQDGWLTCQLQGHI